MASTIVNAAPMTVMLGTQDLSMRALPAVPEDLPTHLPKIYIYAERGPLDPQLVVGSSRSEMYGENSFDLRMPWATHATVLTNLINAQGNSQMIQRVKPQDAPPNANIRIYLDVLATKVADYERNFDGTIKVDVAGLPVPTGTKIDGYSVKWVTAHIARDVDNNDMFGLGNPIPGDQTDTVTSTQSTRYPIMDLEIANFGAYGNNIGLRMWAPTTKSSMPIDDRVISSTNRVYPFRMACVSRPNAITTPTITETLYAEQFVNVVFKKDVIDKNTDALLYVGDVFVQAWQELTNPTAPIKYGPFGRMKLYQDEVDMLLNLFYTAEKPYIDGFSDFTGETDEMYRFNLISGTSSSAVPYHSYQVISGTADSVRFSENTTVYATGGGDGTMNETAFGTLVENLVHDYANENNVLQDTARYPESIIYDSGFPLATKYALCSFIAVRKDTAVVLSTHDVNGPTLSASQESSLAIALRTRLQMYPESEYFGTPTMRGMIIGRSGTMLNTQYRKKLPLTMEIAVKAAKYMGAGNGKWRAGANFDQAPANGVNMFIDVNVTFTPATVRNKDWSNGLNWVESYQRRSLYFPALKTVYDNDTSVLNSFFTMMACVELEKVGLRTHRRFSGESSLTNAQLIERVNAFVIENTTDRFDGRFIIRPDAYFTDADLLRGYSWSLPIKIYAPNMKTVMTLSIQSYRIEDIVGQK